LYKIENIALPNREFKKRGDLYVLFNLVIHQDQKSMIIKNCEEGYIYPLYKADSCYIHRTDESIEPLPTYSPQGIIIESKNQ
jgi:hypothetical protein